MIGKRYFFELSDDEYNMLSAWWAENFLDTNFGAVGGGLTLHITPTSIGEIVVAECRGKEITLRNL